MEGSTHDWLLIRICHLKCSLNEVRSGTDGATGGARLLIWSCFRVRNFSTDLATLGTWPSEVAGSREVPYGRVSPAPRRGGREGPLSNATYPAPHVKTFGKWIQMPIRTVSDHEVTYVVTKSVRGYQGSRVVNIEWRLHKEIEKHEQKCQDSRVMIRIDHERRLADSWSCAKFICCELVNQRRANKWP